MDSLHGKKVLVTGADGFIGSHLVEALVEAGATTRGLVYYNSFNNWGWLEDSKYLSNIEVIQGDVRDPGCCRNMVKGIDIIFNLAALIAIPYSYLAPSSYIDTNIKGGMNICSAALDAGVQKVVQISSSEVYGTAKYVPIDENHPLQPQSPYSASKIGADAITMSFHNSFNLPVVIARPFNTYGPRQSARAVIPTVITQIASGYKQIKLGDTSPTRDFTYVTDTCNGLISLGMCEEAIGRVVNIGSNYEISIHDVAMKIKAILKSDVEIITDDIRKRPENSEVHRLWCDNSLIRDLVGFKPQYSIEQGLKLTADWITQGNNLKKYKADIYNV
jgi:NAD dependent epimerase/dehydratase